MQAEHCAANGGNQHYQCDHRHLQGPEPPGHRGQDGQAGGHREEPRTPYRYDTISATARKSSQTTVTMAMMGVTQACERDRPCCGATGRNSGAEGNNIDS
jgi:hypothetical protein